MSNVSKWNPYQYDINGFGFKKTPGCYVVYLDGKLSYIGQSVNVNKRFLDYDIRFGYGGGIITPWGSYDSVKVKVKYSSELGDWAMLEIKLINRLQPVMNCVGSIRKRRVAL